MDDDFFFYRNPSSKGPFALSLKSYTPDTMSFDGYFYLEDETMPVERMIRFKDDILHVEFLEKKTYEDTSHSGNDATDPDGNPEDNITFFPTNVIELKYRVIKVLTSSIEINEVAKRLEEMEIDVEKRNEPFRLAREKREDEARIEFCKTLDYKSWFSKMDKN